MMWHLWVSMQLILEMFPISSSGHVLLLEQLVYRCRRDTLWLPVTSQLRSTTLLDIIHFPSLVVLGLYFFNRWFIFVRYIRRCWAMLVKLLILVFVTDVMTFLWYLLIRKYHFLTIPLWLGFGITALLLWSLSWCPESNKTWRIWDAVLLGCVQGLALLPGISRYASTFVVARWLGISERHATEISFLIEAPLVGAAFLFALVFEGKIIIWSQLLSLPSLLVILMSSIAAWYVLTLSLYLSRTRQLYYVGWYIMVPLIFALSI